MFGKLIDVKPFIGREKELKKLKLLRDKKIASFVVIRGRRRIGKSRLVEEFGREMPSLLFTGPPPTKETSRQDQLDEFARQMAQLLDLPPIQATDWGTLFFHLSKRCMSGPILLALDEISWMGSEDPQFLGHLKTAWDLYFSKNPELILIVCGSVSSWIEKNILSSTGFVGRISLDLHLKELPLSDAVRFWDGRRARISPYETLKALAVTGCVPRYLEELQPKLSAEENIQLLCFEESGLLFGEFDRIFSDLFSKRAPTYRQIAEALAHGSQSLEQVAHALALGKSTTSGYLRDLIQAGFVTADPTWNFATNRESRLKVYRLSDNYLRFYLRYVLPNRSQILNETFQPESLFALPGWEAMMGLQFENLVLNNLPAVCNALSLPLSSIVRAGPYFQRPTERMRGCQIDLLIQSRYRVLYLCEVKFSADKVGMSVGNEMNDKLERLTKRRGYSYRTVLIHVNGVTGNLLGSGQFDHIIDLSSLT